MALWKLTKGANSPMLALIADHERASLETAAGIESHVESFSNETNRISANASLARFRAQGTKGILSTLKKFVAKVPIPEKISACAKSHVPDEPGLKDLAIPSPKGLREFMEAPERIGYLAAVRRQIGKLDYCIEDLRWTHPREAKIPARDKNAPLEQVMQGEMYIVVRATFSSEKELNSPNGPFKPKYTVFRRILIDTNPSYWARIYPPGQKWNEPAEQWGLPVDGPPNELFGFRPKLERWIHVNGAVFPGGGYQVLNPDQSHLKWHIDAVWPAMSEVFFAKSKEMAHLSQRENEALGTRPAVGTMWEYPPGDVGYRNGAHFHENPLYKQETPDPIASRQMDHEDLVAKFLLPDFQATKDEIIPGVMNEIAANAGKYKREGLADLFTLANHAATSLHLVKGFVRMLNPEVRNSDATLVGLFDGYNGLHNGKRIAEVAELNLRGLQRPLWLYDIGLTQDQYVAEVCNAKGWSEARIKVISLGLKYFDPTLPDLIEQCRKGEEKKAKRELLAYKMGAALNDLSSFRNRFVHMVKSLLTERMEEAKLVFGISPDQITLLEYHTRVLAGLLSNVIVDAAVLNAEMPIPDQLPDFIPHIAVKEEILVNSLALYARLFERDAKESASHFALPISTPADGVFRDTLVLKAMGALRAPKVDAPNRCKAYN